MNFKEFLNESTGKSFWLSPNNKLIPVPDNHVGLVITNPTKFNLTRNYIDQVYHKHKEPVGQEGNAREEIITELVKKKWIRIRRYRDYWSLNVLDTHDRKINNLLAEWAFGMINGDYPGIIEKDRYIDVVITGTKGTPIRTDMESLAKNMNESERVGIELLKEIAMFDPTDDM